MPKRSSSTAPLSLFPESELSKPDSESRRARKKLTTTARKEATPAAGKKTDSEARRQPKLAGLSLRGRPPKRNKASASERATDSRTRRLASGAKRIELMLPATVVTALDQLSVHAKLTRTELLSRMLLKAAARLRRSAEH
jgi:hypothetical protein